MLNSVLFEAYFFAFVFPCISERTAAEQPFCLLLRQKYETHTRIFSEVKTVISNAVIRRNISGINV